MGFGKTIGIIILTIFLMLSSTIFIFDLSINQTIANKTIYLNTLDKVNLKTILPEGIPDSLIKPIKTDISNNLISLINYSIGKTDDFKIQIDKNKYVDLIINMAVKDNPDLAKMSKDQLREKIAPQIDLMLGQSLQDSELSNIKEKVKPIRDFMSIMFSLFWISLIIFILLLILIVFILGFRNAFSLIGNLYLWPALLGVLGIIIVLVNINMFLPKEIDNNIMPVISYFITAIMNNLLYIFIGVVIFGAIFFILHFFMPKKQKN